MHGRCSTLLSPTSSFPGRLCPSPTIKQIWHGFICYYQTNLTWLHLLLSNKSDMASSATIKQIWHGFICYYQTNLTWLHLLLSNKSDMASSATIKQIWHGFICYYQTNLTWLHLLLSNKSDIAFKVRKVTHGACRTIYGITNTSNWYNLLWLKCTTFLSYMWSTAQQLSYKVTCNLSTFCNI